MNHPSARAEYHDSSGEPCNTVCAVCQKPILPDGEGWEHDADPLGASEAIRLDEDHKAREGVTA